MTEKEASPGGMFVLIDDGPETAGRRVDGFDGVRAAIESNKPVWIDLECPGEDDIGRLREQFGFHPLAIEDVVHGAQRPKLEEYEKHLFIVAFGVRGDGQAKFETLEVFVFVGPGYLVTIHSEPVRAISEVRNRCLNGYLAFERGTDRILHAIADGLVDDCFPLLDEFDARIEEIEQEILDSEGGNVLGAIFELRKRLLRFRRLLQPQREMMGYLASREYPWISPSVRTYFRDVYDHLLRIAEGTDSYRELLDTAVETYLTQAAERTNRVVKVLTIIATLGVPLTVVTGFFGMNFRHMPGLDQPGAVPVLIAGMATVEVFLLLVFRRKGWL